MNTAIPTLSGQNHAVRDVTMQSFMPDVVEASMQVPVVVYFWTPRSPQSKQFGQVLEGKVLARQGKIRLARVNVDEQPQIAMQFNVQSVPSTYAVFQGQPVDGFAGVLPEAPLAQFFERLGVDSSHSEEDVANKLAIATELLEQGQPAAATKIFNAILDQDPENCRAIAGLCRCLIAKDRFNEAREILDNLPAKLATDPDIASAKAALALAQEGKKAGGIPGLQEKVLRNPQDPQPRYDLANALFAAGKQEEAVDQLLKILEKDRLWNDSAAHKQLLSYFEAMGVTHPLVIKARRRLSSLLFA